MDKAGCHADFSGFFSAVSNDLPQVNAFNLNSCCCEGVGKLMASMSF